MKLLLTKKKTVDEIIRELRNHVSAFKDDEETTTEKHDVWSLKKTLVLYDYIQPFLTILRNFNYQKIHYHDPFSGTGFLKIKGKIMPGTPLVPLLATKELIKERNDLFFDTVNYSDIKKKSISLLEKRANDLKGNSNTKLQIGTGSFRKMALERFTGFQPFENKRYEN